MRHWVPDLRHESAAGSFAADQRGSIALKFALVLPVLLGITGVTVDYTVILDQRSRLQSAADAASIAAARELGLADAKTENVQSIVEAVVKAYLADNHRSADVRISAAVGNSPLQVNVTATQSPDTPFGSGFGIGEAELTVESSARIAGRPNICVLGLDPSEMGTIYLEKNARVTGNDCAVFSNSSHVSGIKSKNSARLKASLICSRGGKDGSKGNFEPDPIVDCPSFDDPLASRPEPTVGACVETKLTISAQTRTLMPGTYCGGLTITKDSEVTLQPGIYVIKDGPLVVEGRSSVTGQGTGFFFTGTGAVFTFAAASSISLSAPAEGPMAGLLMFEGRNQSKNAQHKILSDDARVLLGTIYLSRGELHVDATSPIADQSAYTAIVARTMRLYGGPHLVLNTNYDMSPIPVPEGIKGAGQPLALVK